LTKLRSVEAAFKPHLLKLFSYASSLRTRNNKYFLGKIQDIVENWKIRKYYTDDFLDKLAVVVKNAGNLGGIEEIEQEGKEQEDEDATGTRKEAPYQLPKSHGDPSMPWYHLPAGVMLHSMSLYPHSAIHESDMKPIPLKAGPARPDLENAVRSLLEKASRLDEEGDDQTEMVDINIMGQKTFRNRETGVETKEDTYYGFTKEFADALTVAGSRFTGESSEPPTKIQRWELEKNDASQ
jgi:hypothetical protein